ncbi:MAG: response regulator [Armatimonadota bacterium]
MSTILIVEDHAMSRQVLCSLLGYLNHRVLEASDGVDALALARAERPDLVITDIVMPNMDGIELIRELRAGTGMADMPIIVYTATYRVLEARSLVDPFGPCRVIAKPADPTCMLQAINEMLGLSSVEGVTSPKARSDVLVSQSAGLQLSAIVDLNFHLVSQHDLPTLAELFCRATRAILKCQQSLLAVIEEGQTSYFLGEDGHEPMSACPVALLPTADILERVTQRLTFQVQHVPGKARKASGLSLLAVPLATNSRVHGWFCAIDKLDHLPFGEVDEEIAMALCGQAALAYENILLIRQLQRQTAELERERAFLDAAIEVLPLPLAFFDQQGQVIRANQATRMLLRQLDITGHEEACFLHAQTYSAIPEHRQPALRALQGETVTAEEYLITASGDGRQLPVLVSAAPIRLADESIAAVSIV